VKLLDEATLRARNPAKDPAATRAILRQLLVRGTVFARAARPIEKLPEWGVCLLDGTIGGASTACEIAAKQAALLKGTVIPVFAAITALEPSLGQVRELIGRNCSLWEVLSERDRKAAG
jgi:hypothetical protein